MAATPLLTILMPKLCDVLGQSPWFGGMFHDSPAEDDIGLSDHVIIAGFGINGRSLATALAEFGVPHVILELNPETVRTEASLGIDIRYGDCTRQPILEHAGIFRARALVVAISDPASARRSVRVARDLVPELEIFVRTEYLSEVDELRLLGADVVVPAEFETALSLFERVLSIYDVPEDKIDDLVDQLRLENYGFLRSGVRRRTMQSVEGPDLHDQLGRCRISQCSVVVGQTFGALDVRATTGVTIIAIQRNNQQIRNPGPSLKLQIGDEVSFVGSRSERIAAHKFFLSTVTTTDPI